jgi:hypothetical protein
LPAIRPLRVEQEITSNIARAAGKAARIQLLFGVVSIFVLPFIGRFHH